MIAPPYHTRRKTTTDSWITPEWLINALGPFDLDPCACDPQPWPTASKMITERENGLLSIWKGFVWLNPPYGNALGTWLERLSVHGNGIALTFARTETRAFQKHVWPAASSLLFIAGRLTFYTPEGNRSRNGGNSGGPSVLIAYGAEAARRLDQCRHLGAVVKLRKG